MAVARWLGKPTTAPAIMDRVLVALVPAVGVAAWLFGWQLLVHCVVALAAGAVFEALCQTLRKRPVRPFADRSTPVTCLLIAIGIPPSAPLWIPLVAVAVAILLAKELYGGLGRNVFNPAMAGYAAVLVAYPQSMTLLHATTGATALDAFRFRGGQTLEDLAGNPAFGMLGGAGFEWVNVAAL
ncbi:MAG: RnfABCDGE type electron transport complex subunit D, partial [Gammaproteobacteria bacterium]|nr:RnfABCDGE type electron transport complex subunit D [Gammaproteobacteria bacterium]